MAARAEPRVDVIEEHHPQIEEDAERGKTIEFARSTDAQSGTFTDKAAVHLVTKATMETLSGLYPSGNFEVLRFRPNVLVDTAGARGFVETGWVGRTLAVGAKVQIKVFAECGRCVMTTLPQGKLASDIEILRTVMRFNRGKVGVYASVLTGGEVKKSDQVVLM